MNTSIKAPSATQGYIFGPDIDMSTEEQDRIFLHTIHADEFTDGWLPKKHDRVTDENDVEYLVIDVTDDSATLLFNGYLPCTVDWCAGHTHNEADTWDALWHASEDRYIELPGDYYEKELAATCHVLEGGAPGLRVEVDIIATVSGDNVGKIIKDLYRIAAEIRQQARLAGVTA